MASITKRRNADGGIAWDARVRVIGYPTAGKSFDTKLAAQLWASKLEAQGKSGGAVFTPKGMTFDMLLDELLPNLKNPTKSAFDYWRAVFGGLRVEKITPLHIGTHLQKLLGECRGYNHKTAKPSTPATVRNTRSNSVRLFAEAARLGLVESNLCARVKKPSVDNQVVRFLSDDDRAKLLAECKASESSDSTRSY